MSSPNSVLLRIPRAARGSEGFALFSVLLALIVVGALVTAAFATTRTEVANVRSTTSAATGFYSAEAGLNIRGELVRNTFQGYVRPAGDSPDAEDACLGGNTGDDDFECMWFDLNDRDVKTYVAEDPRNNNPNDADRMVTIPSG